MATHRRSWGHIRKLPSGRYQASYRDIDGGPLTPAPQTFATKAAADRWLSKKRAELDAGTAVDERSGNRLLSEWWEPYERTLAGLKASTRSNYEAAWRLRIQPAFGDTSSSTDPGWRRRRVGVDDDRRWCFRSKIAESLGVLKRILGRVVRDRAISSNPCAERAVTLTRKQATDRPVLTPTEIEKVVAGCAHERDKLLIRLLAYGGLRIGEAFALQWTNVNLDQRTVRIRESVESSNGPQRIGPTKTYATPAQSTCRRSSPCSLRRIRWVRRQGLYSPTAAEATCGTATGAETCGILHSPKRRSSRCLMI